MIAIKLEKRLELLKEKVVFIQTAKCEVVELVFAL